MVGGGPRTPKRIITNRDPLDQRREAATPLRTLRGSLDVPIHTKPRAELQDRVGNQPPIAVDAGTLSFSPPTLDGPDSQPSIHAWANHVISASPPPLSSYHRSSEGTPTHRVDEGKVVIDGIEREAWEVLIEEAISEPPDPSEDVVSMKTRHARQIAHYKDLLVRAQSASSASLHDLHSKLHELEGRYRALQEGHAKCGIKLRDAQRRNDLEQVVVQSLEADKTVRGVVERLTKKDRVEMLGIIAEACHPSDIDAQIKILERCKRSKMDILCRLPDHIATRVLVEVDIPDVLVLRSVCHRYRDICDRPEMWRRRCHRLEWRDRDGEAALHHLRDVKESEWQPLFKRLWQREKNWKTGSATRIQLLEGHTNYVTSLKLRGDTLISGSYDETIRIWQLPSIGQNHIRRPDTLPAKAVSSLDYYPPEEVLVVGPHDVGRVQVFQREASTDDWSVIHTLSGHLHGIRAVAIGEKWLVSSGSDKALVVWDWRTGGKVVRFGQQTNIGVNIQLVHDYIVAITVDGMIRVFSIKAREMIAQYRLSDLHGNEPALRVKLKDIGGGVGGAGMINWFEGHGRDMVCASRDIILRLQWGEIDEKVLETTKFPTATPSYASPRTRPVSMSRTVSAPVTPSKAPAHRAPNASVTRTPLRLKTQGEPGASGSRPIPTPLPTRQMKGVSPLKRTSTASSPSAHSPTVSTTPRKTSSRKTSNAPSSIVEEVNATCQIRMMPDFTRPPILKEVIKASDVERGAVDARGLRIVTSTRFASRFGANRHLYIAAPNEEGKSDLIPVARAWSDCAAELGLQTPGKNPMSLVMDREKLIYGCTDGTIVVVHFADPGC